MRRIAAVAGLYLGLVALIILSTPSGGLHAAPAQPLGPTAIPTPPCPSPAPGATPTPLAILPAPVNLFQDGSPAVVFTGTWRTVDDPLALGGAYASSSTPGDKVQFSFTGESAVLFRKLDQRGGRAVVKIDGVPVIWDGYGWLRFAFESPRWRVPAVFDNLKPGPHTLTIETSERAGDYGGTSVYVDAFAAPSPYAANEAELQALAQVNEYRGAAGLPPVRLSGALNLAAQAHAQYVAWNGWTDIHGERSCMPGFTGFTGGARAAYFGYPPWDVSEGLAGVGDGVAAIDTLMRTVYHREPILDYGAVSMGFGLNTGSIPAEALEMGQQPDARIPPTAHQFSTYPIDGQAGVPLAWSGAEYPDPLPPGAARPVGYPVSIHFAAADVNLAQLRVVELRDEAGQVVPIYLVLDTRSVFLLPQQPLLPGRRYTARVVGAWPDTLPLDSVWSFTTIGSPPYLPLLLQPAQQ